MLHWVVGKSRKNTRCGEESKKAILGVGHLSNLGSRAELAGVVVGSPPLVDVLLRGVKWHRKSCGKIGAVVSRSDVACSEPNLGVIGRLIILDVIFECDGHL